MTNKIFGYALIVLPIIALTIIGALIFKGMFVPIFLSAIITTQLILIGVKLIVKAKPEDEPSVFNDPSDEKMLLGRIRHLEDALERSCGEKSRLNTEISNLEFRYHTLKGILDIKEATKTMAQPHDGATTPSTHGG